MTRMFSTHGQRYPSTIPHRRWPCRLLALAVLGLACAPLHAGCTVSADGMIFGNYNGSEVDGTGTITVTGCPDSTSYTITLSPGFSDNFNTRTMQNTNDASHTLNYNLYTDSARVSIWGNGTNSTTISGTSTGTASNYSVYGRIPAGQNPYVGSYSDAIVVTLQF